LSSSAQFVATQIGLAGNWVRGNLETARSCFTRRNSFWMRALILLPQFASINSNKKFIFVKNLKRFHQGVKFYGRKIVIKGSKSVRSRHAQDIGIGGQSLHQTFPPNNALT
jgi:hypothetical protein